MSLQPVCLMVPIHLDGLKVADDLPVRGPSADFSRLPYFDRQQKRDVNGDVANISEEIVAEPFDQQNLYLKPGVHLHWALPDALTNGAHTPAGTVFPPAPNRWLITRTMTGREPRQWVVESDYLFPEDKGAGSGSVCIPCAVPQGGTGQPFRYLGRCLPLEAWAADPGDTYLKETMGIDLTATGYGDPTFAAFYPNCCSVFGFQDDGCSGDEAGLAYDVLGWHSRPGDDPLQTQLGGGGSVVASLESVLAWTPIAGRTVANELERFQLTGLAAGDTVKQSDTGGLYEVTDAARLNSRDGYVELVGLPPDVTVATEAGLFALAAIPEGTIVKQADTGALHRVVDAARLNSPDGYSEVLSLRMVCFARLTFGSAAGGGAVDNRVQVAVANTGTEALSALLASMLADQPQVDPDQAASDKEIIEDQLEALSLSARLDHRQLDVGPKFEEARHAKGFTGVDGGALWTVVPKGTATDPADASRQVQVTLPLPLALELNELNLRQQAFDRAQREITALRTQLFADWYKYMLSAYPPAESRDSYPNIDEVRLYIQRNGLAPLDLKLAERSQLAAQLADAKAAVEKSLADFDRGQADAKTGLLHELKPLPGPRFYEPNDPVVLLAGPVVTPVLRHGNDGRLRKDGLLECQLVAGADLRELVPKQPGASTGARQALFARLREAINTLAAAGQGSIGLSEWSAQPWNPFLMEWEAEVFPLDHLSNVDPATGCYDPHFMTGNYRLEEDEPDVRIDEEATAMVSNAANVYLGASLLTPHANASLTAQLDDYLEEQLLEKYFTGTAVPAEARVGGYYAAHRAAVLTWAVANLNQGDNDGALEEVVSQLLRCRQKLDGLYTLSQSLGGFNEALLMHKQTFQLPIADPLGFEEYQEFTRSVAELVADRGIRAAQPLNDFNPIRSGALKLLRLRLVDTFGQVRDLAFDRVVTTGQLSMEGSPHEISLPPRLSQPARLNFRWLSAQDDALEMNDHPATSPVCGWVLPNNLDHSLMIHDNAGKALGSIDRNAAWESAPGDRHPIAAPEDIANKHLGKMVRRIMDRGAGFIEPFLSAIDVALENIEPENFAQHQDLALLMGRPIALVRASVELELADLPAVNQGWDAFRQDLRSSTRSTDGFELVEFPIRVGEYQQFNDGLVGYWREDPKDATFYAPQSEQSPELSAGDFAKPLDLATRLLDRTNAVSRYLQRTPAWTGAVDDALRSGDGDRICEALVGLLNERVELTRSIFQKKRFDGVTLSPWTAKKMSQKPRGEERRWLNRWLLEDAYRDLIDHARHDATDAVFIATHTADDSLVLRQSLAAPPQTLLMLMDPRGVVHATCGILPAKAISLPPDQYADALAAIEITFLSSPVLTDMAKLRLPLPVEPGYRWSWLQEDRDEWTEVTAPGVVKLSSLESAFPPKESGAPTRAGVVWNALTQSAWIEETEPGLGTIQPKDKRKDLPGVAAEEVALIESLLDRAEIGPVNPGADFSGPQQIREGWLKLSLAPKKTVPAP